MREQCLARHAIGTSRCGRSQASASALMASVRGSSRGLAPASVILNGVSSIRGRPSHSTCAVASPALTSSNRSGIGTLCA